MEATCDFDPTVAPKNAHLAVVANLEKIHMSIQYPISVETHIWGKQIAAILTLYTGKGVTPEVNLRECISNMFLSCVNKAACSGFENQRRCHQKSKTEESVAPKNAHLAVVANLEKIHMRTHSFDS